MTIHDETVTRQNCCTQIKLMMRSERLLKRYIDSVGRCDACEARRLMGLVKRVRQIRERLQRRY